MIPSRRLLAAITVAAMLMATPAVAEWVVARVSQPARYSVDGRSWRLLTLGEEVPNHAWIHTGRTGRLLLRDSGDMIQFKPNTVAAISRRASGGTQATTILQKFGSILIDVEPHPGRRRSVETPYLAAIVKGTRFEVDVDRTSTEVRVHKGVVEATHLTLGRRAHVRAGQVALAQGHRRFAVRGRGPEPRMLTIEPREPRVSPARPAREPARMSAPHSSGDDRDDAEFREQNPERQLLERLVESALEREKDRNGRRDRKEKKRDRPEKEDDDSADDADDEPDTDGDADDEPDADDPGDDNPDTQPPDTDDDPDDYVDLDFDDARAPTWRIVEAGRRG